jgi:trimethylamine monooxygenase
MEESRLRVAVIGAGPSGTAQLHAFASAEKVGAKIPEIVCYDKQTDWGGLWNFTWRTGTDEFGEPVHGSMYRYLWSNGSKESAEFADYGFDEHFGRPIPSFPPREVLVDYIKGRMMKSGVRKWVKFNHVCRNVCFDKTTGQFTVTIKDLIADRVFSEIFDFVVIATGHFSVPNVPSFDGLDKFLGRVMHSHDFRTADEFAGKDIVIVGSSASAEDIAVQCLKYGAKNITISYRTEPMDFEWPSAIKEVPLITNIERNVVYFKDGSSTRADAIILCTGYLHHHPYMADELRLKSINQLYPPGLYNGIAWETNTKLLYIGMQEQYYTFNMFDVQAWWARDVIMGRIQLPSAAEMSTDIAEWVKRETTLEDLFEEIDFQTDYVKKLASLTDYPDFSWDAIGEILKEEEHHKIGNILTYRDRSYKSVLTGTQAPPPAVTWMKALDDSKEWFMSNH